MRCSEVPWNGTPERVRAPFGAAESQHRWLPSSRVVWECSPKWVVNSI